MIYKMLLKCIYKGNVRFLFVKLIFFNYYYLYNEFFNIKVYEFDLWLGWMIIYKCLRRR